MEARTYSSAALEAIVLPEAGARLHRLRAFGHDLLRTPHEPAIHQADPFFWGAFICQGDPGPLQAVATAAFNSEDIE